MKYSLSGGGGHTICRNSERDRHYERYCYHEGYIRFLQGLVAVCFCRVVFWSRATISPAASEAFELMVGICLQYSSNEGIEVLMSNHSFWCVVILAL